MFVNPSMQEICAELDQIRTIAVVGLSANSARPAYQVARALQMIGWRIIPVRPMSESVLGERAYPDLASIPEPVDLVDVFRAPEHVPDLVEACLRLGLPRIWLQQGVVHEAAALRAREAGLWVVMDRCLWRDHEYCCGR